MPRTPKSAGYKVKRVGEYSADLIDVSSGFVDTFNLVNKGDPKYNEGIKIGNKVFKLAPGLGRFS